MSWQPQLSRLMRNCQKGDVVVAVRVDRFGPVRNDVAQILDAIGAIVLWSWLTALGGFAHGMKSLLVSRNGMKSLLVSRIGVAVGEAALTPAAHSIIADYVDRGSRAKAIAIYSLGLSIGTFLALSLGGYLNDRFGWRTTLFITGASGFALSMLVLATIREPRREQASGQHALPKGDLVSMLRNGLVRNLVLGRPASVTVSSLDGR
jgi:predicted MFS family arabinose efflux permease